METKAQLQDRIREVLTKDGPHTVRELMAALDDGPALKLRKALKDMPDVKATGQTRACRYELVK